MAMENEPRDNRSVATLFSDLVNQMTTLFRTEVQLLKTELREGGSKLGAGAMEIAAGAILLLCALLILLFALVEVLENWMAPSLAALIVGALVAIIGAMLLKRGKDNLDPSVMMPDRTTRQVQKDATLVKEEVR